VTPVYFDTSVFLAIFNKEPIGVEVRKLLRELKHGRSRIHTSIISVQEASVLGYRRGMAADDNHSEMNRLARIHTITKQIALTAAKFEAELKDQMDKASDKNDRVTENRRRKWDCFHIATAVVLQCRTIYTCDEGMFPRKSQLGLGLEISHPVPMSPDLPFPEGTSPVIPGPIAS
jgi:predicted nucleic acid-binding protein